MWFSSSFPIKKKISIDSCDWLVNFILLTVWLYFNYIKRKQKLEVVDDIRCLLWTKTHGNQTKTKPEKKREENLLIAKWHKPRGSIFECKRSSSSSWPTLHPAPPFLFSPPPPISPLCQLSTPVSYFSLYNQSKISKIWVIHWPNFLLGQRLKGPKGVYMLRGFSALRFKYPIGIICIYVL